jgi:hypothetical protein
MNVIEDPSSADAMELARTCEALNSQEAQECFRRCPPDVARDIPMRVAEVCSSSEREDSNSDSDTESVPCPMDRITGERACENPGIVNERDCMELHPGCCHFDDGRCWFNGSLVSDSEGSDSNSGSDADNFPGDVPGDLLHCFEMPLREAEEMCQNRNYGVFECHDYSLTRGCCHFDSVLRQCWFGPLVPPGGDSNSSDGSTTIYVTSTTSFSDLEISAFDDQAFRSSFERTFIAQMASFAQVLPNQVAILSIASGSVQVRERPRDANTLSSFSVVIQSNSLNVSGALL